MPEEQARADIYQRMPYGYKRGIHNRDEYIRDDSAAETVKRMFQMAADGRTYSLIADKLNEEGVDPPQRHRLIAAGADSEEIEAHTGDKWTHMTIRRILTNPVYLGHLPASRDVREKSGDEGGSLDAKIREKDHHEPIVSLSLFQAANAMRGTQRLESDLENPFAGFAFCASCGSPLVSSIDVSADGKVLAPVLRCRRKKMTKNRCTSAAEITMGQLQELVLNELNELIDEHRSLSKAGTLAVEAGNADPFKEVKKRLDNIKERLEMISTVSLKIYEDMERGLLHRYSGQEMVRIYNAEITDLLEEQAHLMLPETVTPQEAGPEPKADCFDKLGKIKELNSSVLSSFIRRIEVGPKIYQGDAKGRARSSAFFDQAINITYTFSQEPLV